MLIRIAGWQGDAALAADLADLVHNLPMFLAGDRGTEDWTKDGFHELFAADLRRRRSELSLDWDSLPRGA